MATLINIDLVPPYLLLKVQSTVGAIEDISDTPTLAWGQLYQKSAGSTLVLGTNYCIDGEIKTISFQGTAYFLTREDSLRFIEPAPM